MAMDQPRVGETPPVFVGRLDVPAQGAGAKDFSYVSGLSVHPSQGTYDFRDGDGIVPLLLRPLGRPGGCSSTAAAVLAGEVLSRMEGFDIRGDGAHARIAERVGAMLSRSMARGELMPIVDAASQGSAHLMLEKGLPLSRRLPPNKEDQIFMPAWLRTVVIVIFNFGTSILLVNSVKYLYTFSGFEFPLFIASMHMVFSWALTAFIVHCSEDSGDKVLMPSDERLRKGYERSGFTLNGPSQRKAGCAKTSHFNCCQMCAPGNWVLTDDQWRAARSSYFKMWRLSAVVGNFLERKLAEMHGAMRSQELCRFDVDNLHDKYHEDGSLPKCGNHLLKVGARLLAPGWDDAAEAEKVGKYMEASIFRAMSDKQLPDNEKLQVEAAVHFLRELCIFASELQLEKHLDSWQEAYDFLHGR
ncbi:hypothetical protein AK812_SmicGene25535 [Symbiodinium microadriaticum]|uniref:Uncharacterized protein n=1 Tax=Symbiodinium microadriaticum TaxID=2951 RepID=A0A1Q9DBV8_SYMMI|nr:hypothetical protein AK812_SmicGene25535 [Symbiodinium microadriaticum]